MKTLQQTFVLLTLATTLQGCASLTKMKNNLFADNKKPSKVQAPQKFTFKDTFHHFDKVEVDVNKNNIVKMISIVQPELDEKTKQRYARDIHNSSVKHNIKPQIIIALIDSESDFQYTKISHTGDLSIAQINIDIWNKEFKWMKKSLIKKSKLTTKDQGYAVDSMGRILAVLKKRYEKKDRRWYARYHSNTPTLKYSYLKKIDTRLKLMAKAQYSAGEVQLAMGSK